MHPWTDQDRALWPAGPGARRTEACRHYLGGRLATLVRRPDSARGQVGALDDAVVVVRSVTP